MNDNTFLKSNKTEDAQKIAVFSGEGAYHGSSKIRNDNKTFVLETEVEKFPASLMYYWKRKDSNFMERPFYFTNLCEIKKLLQVPTQEEIKNDAVTFCWCPIEQAKQEAGPITKNILLEMESFLERKKKFIYIDSKIQYFQKGDLPVDSKLWHIDGTISVRDQRSQELGYTLLHDMRARAITALGFGQNTKWTGVPKYLAYQSSLHCATQFVKNPLSVVLPDCIPNFDILDRLVQEANPEHISQPAGSIISFDGLSLHRAVPAQVDGWRLWIRCVETDCEVKLNSSIINCYGTVFRTE